MDDEAKDGCVECMRYGFVLLNSLFVLLGVVFLFLGVWFYAVPANKNLESITLQSEEQMELSVAMLLVIGVGSAVCVLSLCGCYGAFSKTKFFLIMVGLLLIILIVLELVIVGFSLVYHEQMKRGLTDKMARTLAFQYVGDDGETRESLAWREMQKGFRCCGVNTTQGYKNHTQMMYMNVTGSLWYRTVGNTSSQEWPESCCSEPRNNTTNHGNITCFSKNKAKRYLNEQGCADEITSFFQTHLLGIVFVAGILIACEALAMLLCFKLWRAIPKKVKVDTAYTKVYSGVRVEDF